MATTVSLKKLQVTAPYIRYFQIAREVIEENIAALAERSGKSRTEICEAIRAQYQHCRNEWYSDREPILNYHKPICRLAYLYGVVPATASVVEEAFASDDDLRKYFFKVAQKRGNVSVCAFGGGPGTELLGLAKWIERSGPAQPIYLDYLLLDRVNEWLDSWKALKRQIEIRFRHYYGNDRQRWPVIISSGFFSAIDMKSVVDTANLGSIFDQDLYILSYLISEIFSNFENLETFTREIARRVPKGAKFLFIDRKGVRWKNEVMAVAKQAGITLSDFHDTSNVMDPRTEDSGDLGSLKKEIGEDPKLRWNAFWVVGSKN